MSKPPRLYATFRPHGSKSLYGAINPFIRHLPAERSPFIRHLPAERTPFIRHFPAERFPKSLRSNQPVYTPPSGRTVPVYTPLTGRTDPRLYATFRPNGSQSLYGANPHVFTPLSGRTSPVYTSLTGRTVPKASTEQSTRLQATSRFILPFPAERSPNFNGITTPFSPTTG
jgi:hypothetical protein